MRELRRMERFAADAIKAERDSYVRAAIRNHAPFQDIMADYGASLAEIIAIAEIVEGGERKGSALLTEIDNTPQGRRGHG